MKNKPNRALKVAGLILFVLAAGFIVFQTLRHAASNVPPLEIDRSGLTNQNGQLFVTGETNSFTGVMTESYPDGSPKSRSDIVNGRMHGKSEGFYPDGQRQIEEHFILGMSEGIRTRWSTNGVKQSEGQIVQADFHGDYRKWHENGQLAEFIRFEKGEPHGTATSWYPSGFLKSRVEMDHGEIKEQETWNDGEMQGESRSDR